MNFSLRHIYDFAQSHDIGSDIFINVRTCDIIELPNPNRRPYAELEEFYEEDIKNIEVNWCDIKKLECPDSDESFDIMASFVEQLSESTLRSQLVRALNKSKPFRNFNHIIHNSDKRENWFEHKRLKLEERVHRIMVDIGNANS